MNSLDLPEWFLFEIEWNNMGDIEKIFKPDYLQERLNLIQKNIEEIEHIKDFFNENNVFDPQYFPNGVEFHLK